MPKHKKFAKINQTCEKKMIKTHAETENEEQ